MGFYSAPHTLQFMFSQSEGDGKNSGKELVFVFETVGFDNISMSILKRALIAFFFLERVTRSMEETVACFYRLFDR